ncbi:MAG: OmpA family protein [Bacteroidales bacterium]|nr:OmpA family protein [Bacteroidales bacterium]
MTKIFAVSFLLMLIAFPSFSQQGEKEKSKYKVGGFWDHWYISVGGGAQMYFGEDDNNAPLASRISPAFQVTAGKWFTPALGARVQLGGIQLYGWNDGIGGTYLTKDKVRNPLPAADPQRWRETDGKPRKWVKPIEFDKNVHETLTEYHPELRPWGDPEYVRHGGNPDVADLTQFPNAGTIYRQEINYVDLHVDIMLNTIQAFHYKPKRAFHFIPYAGIGIAYTPGNDYLVATASFSPQLGTMLNFRLSNRIDLGLDVRASAVRESFDSHLGGEDPEGYNYTWEGYLGTTLNLIVKLKNYDFEEVYEMPKQEVDNINTIIGLQNPPPLLPPPSKKVFLPPVHFPLDVHIVQRGEMHKVEMAARYLFDSPVRTLHLEGYADRKTGNERYNQRISERRVREVRRLLVERFGVDPGRLTIGWQGDLEQPFPVNELNRAVLFIGDEDSYNGVGRGGYYEKYYDNRLNNYVPDNNVPVPPPAYGTSASYGAPTPPPAAYGTPPASSSYGATVYNNYNAAPDNSYGGGSYDNSNYGSSYDNYDNSSHGSRSYTNQGSPVNRNSVGVGQSNRSISSRGGSSYQINR